MASSISSPPAHTRSARVSEHRYAYQTGFGNHFSSSAVPGALPEGRNSPQRAPLGLYNEQLSGTAFTAPRSENRRTWLYRIRPSVTQGAFRRIDNRLLRSGPFTEAAPPPTQLRWDPLPMPTAPTQAIDWLDSLITIGGNGDPDAQSGLGIHLYAANRSMVDRVFYDADGELLIVPQQGEVRFVTELGVLEVMPGEIAVMPRGMRFRVELPEGAARGYVCENYGAMFRLPELGPIGSNGLANTRDFLVPVAAYEDVDRAHEIVAKFAGNLWSSPIDHSPLDVVAWHGNHVPYKYDTARFMTIGSISFDHPDPSIFTLLTSPSGSPGVANVDFVIFPPRWLVGEDTFRPPWFHRNIMSEYMGLVHGAYDAKAGGFVPGGGSLHNCMSPHGPDATSFERASGAALKPEKLEHTLAFMFESRYIIRPTRFALEAAELQQDYLDCWRGLGKHFNPVSE